MTTDAEVSLIRPLDLHWEVKNPYLFCAHHRDLYPAGNEWFGPAAPLSGRNIGQDFTLKDGWRMYHGSTIPGFPSHPHRGFETVTIVMEGFVDHSDSHGQSGRYGAGDVQWMTAGAGLQHCEMFPLLRRDQGNPLELFQVWINLPRQRKFATPWFRMFWKEQIPVFTHADMQGRKTMVNLIAGSIGTVSALPPGPDSWAAEPGNEVAIWTIRMESNAVWSLPTASAEASRTLYFYRGDLLEAGAVTIPERHSFEVRPDDILTLRNGDKEALLVLLQGKPILEPVVQYGPFVMNTDAEIREAFADFRATGFGGWPWKTDDHIHPGDAGRFASYRDGRVEKPENLFS